MAVKNDAFRELCVLLNKHLNAEGFPSLFYPSSPTPVILTGLMLVTWLSADWRKTTEEMGDVLVAIHSVSQEAA